MASATFTVNGSPVSGAMAVSASSTVNLALTSTSGVGQVAWSIVGNHSTGATNPTITAAGSPTGVTASFPMPAGAGQGYLVQCVVNGGIDDEGNIVSAQTFRAVIGVINVAGYVPICAGEETARSTTHGWGSDLNEMIDAATAAAGYTAPSGATANRITYSTAADGNQWSTTIWSDGTYLATGAAGSFATTGAIRLAPGTTYGITAKLATGSDANLLWYVAGGGITDITLGTAAYRNLNFATGTALYAYINSALMLTVGDGWIGIGVAASQPTSGTLRVATAFELRGYLSGYAAGARLVKWTEATKLLDIGSGTAAEAPSVINLRGGEVDIYGSTSLLLKANSGGYLLFDVDMTHVITVTETAVTLASGIALDITGARVRASTETTEYRAHGKTAIDAGADGAPVTVVTYTVPTNTRATLHCKVVLETDSTKVPYYWTEFKICVYRTTGNAIESSTPVDPDAVADPAGASIDVTYTCGASGVVTIFKQNTSATAMIASGEIEAEEAVLVGTGI